MPWLELKIDANQHQIEDIEQALLDAGALSVTYQDAGDVPVLEPGVGEVRLWPEISMTGLFDADNNTGLIEQKLASYLQQKQQELPYFIWQILEDRQWETTWMEYAKPMQFGENFWVHYEDVVEENATTLLLDPGLAFGTGSHPTTSLCLTWLVEQQLEQKTVLDFGCGTGILAIAALMNGASTVTGIDIDPQALTATQNNSVRNGFSKDSIDLYLPKSAPTRHYDVVVANILAGPLLELCDDIANAVVTGGLVCLSGILAKQADAIQQAYHAHFDDITIVEEDGWIRVSGIKR